MMIELIGWMIGYLIGFPLYDLFLWLDDRKADKKYKQALKDTATPGTKEYSDLQERIERDRQLITQGWEIQKLIR